MKVRLEFDVELPGDTGEKLSEMSAAAVKDALDSNSETVRRVNVAPGIDAVITVVP